MSHVPDEELDPQHFSDVEAVRRISSLALDTLNGLVDGQFGSVFDEKMPDIVATAYQLDDAIVTLERETLLLSSGRVEYDELSIYLTSETEQGLGTTCITIEVKEVADKRIPDYITAANSLMLETDRDFHVENPEVQKIHLDKAIQALVIASKDLGGWKAITPSLSSVDEPIDRIELADTSLLTFADFLNETKDSLTDTSPQQYSEPINIDPKLQNIFISFLASVALYRLGASSEYTQSLEDVGIGLSWGIGISGLMSAMKIYFDYKHTIPEAKP